MKSKGYTATVIESELKPLNERNFEILCGPKEHGDGTASILVGVALIRMD